VQDNVFLVEGNVVVVGYLVMLVIVVAFHGVVVRLEFCLGEPA
jgi:hypothetical protein